MTDVDYKDDVVLAVNTPAQEENPLHSLEQQIESIVVSMNTKKNPKLMRFKQKMRHFHPNLKA